MSDFATDKIILQACEEIHNYLLDTPYSSRYIDMLVARVQSKLRGKDYFYNEKHFDNLCINFAISKGMMEK